MCLEDMRTTRNICFACAVFHTTCCGGRRTEQDEDEDEDDHEATIEAFHAALLHHEFTMLDLLAIITDRPSASPQYTESSRGRLRDLYEQVALAVDTM